MNSIKSKFHFIFMVIALVAFIIFLSAFENVMIGKLSISAAIFAFLILIKQHQKIKTHE